MTSPITSFTSCVQVNLKLELQGENESHYWWDAVLSCCDDTDEMSFLSQFCDGADEDKRKALMSLKKLSKQKYYTARNYFKNMPNIKASYNKLYICIIVRTY